LKRAEVPAYYSGIPGATAEARVENALRQAGEGFANFKIFYDCGRDEFFEGFFALRRALGDGAGLAADALWRLTPETASAFEAELAKRSALWLEAPLQPESARMHGDLAHAVQTPIAIGESYRTLFELQPFFEADAMRIVQPDLGRTGITEGLRIAREAERRGIEVIPHVSIAMGPQIAAAIHFAAAVPNCRLLEFNPNVLSTANRYLRAPLRVEEQAYIVPDEPGLGVAYNPSLSSVAFS